MSDERKIIVTMRSHDWVMMSHGFLLALDMPAEADRIRAEFDRHCTPSGPNPEKFSIEFPYEFAGGRAPFSEVLKSLAGPMPIEIEVREGQHGGDARRGERLLH